ncbi:MAG: glycoside hydrolase family 31 protein [Segetibacter sp.]|nr:glycoside hydrolase family 31 protein [Segetibacter sp.]
MKCTICFILPVLLLCLNASAQKPEVAQDGRVSIYKADGSWTFTRFKNSVIKITHQPVGYKTNELVSDAVIAVPLKEKPVVNTTAKGSIISWEDMQMELIGDTIKIGNDQLIVLAKNTTANNNGFNFILTPSEKIFGAGERALPLNRRGYRFNLYNNPWYGYGMGADNLNYSVPFITSSNNYALFFDNPSKSYLDIGKTTSNVLQYGASSGEINVYVITGNSYARILSSYHQLTGTQPVPPRWALGNFLSRFGYKSEEHIEGIMDQMKQHKIPYDAVIFDLFWFGDSVKGTMGNLAWVNKKAWPNPRKMISDFKKEGTKTILITEPFVVRSSLNYTASKKFHAVDSAGNPYVLKDFYFGEAGLIDIFRNDSKDWFWSKYKPQMKLGVEGWWGDLGEPEKHPENLYHNLKSLGFKRLFKADEVHNLYGHLWTKMLFDKYAKEYPTKRLFSLNRSGFAGTQRYGIFPWSGDVSRSWNGLQAQLPVMLGMSMSGVPYIHADAGGFAGGEKDPELYIRWLQFASYTPIFRPHGTELTGIENNAINYPSEPALFDEPHRSIAKRIVDERYAMLPYNYTLAYEQAANAKPLVSPLYYYFSADTTTYNVEDEFMWGENILVAPILQKGAATRRVYLPKGKWYDQKFFTQHEGDKWYTDSAQLASMPIYLKAGSFIPYVGKPLQNTTEYSTEKLMVTYLPSADSSSFTLFDDDGSTNNSIKKKLFELIKFETTGWNKTTRFTITSNQGKFKGKPPLRTFDLVIPTVANIPHTVMLNGRRLLQQETPETGAHVFYNNQMGALYIHFSFTGKKIQIDIVQ